MSGPEVSQASRRDAAALLDAVIGAAEGGAEEIRHFDIGRSVLEWREKSPADFVSEADHAAEHRIREMLLRRYPSATIVAEEGSPTTDPGGALAFVIDPLDGTTNFLHGYPEYAVSIAAVRDGQPVAAVVLNVPTTERFSASLGGGARRDEQLIHVSSIATPGRALIGTGFPSRNPALLTSYLEQFARVLRPTAGVRRAGSAALDLADIACGRLDAFWELRLAPWDVAAGILLVREAGGVVTNIDGEPSPVAHGSFVAGNPEMHAWLLGVLHNEESSTSGNPG